MSYETVGASRSVSRCRAVVRPLAVGFFWWQWSSNKKRYKKEGGKENAKGKEKIGDFRY